MMATSVDDQTVKEIEGIPPSKLDELKHAFQDGGTTALSSLTSSLLNQWRNVEVTIGIIGNSGVGKSSFINALRGLTAEDQGAAEVGVTETTTHPTPYKHPDNDNLVLWDLPGVNTPNFPKDEYFEKIGMAKYDYFIIISATRFSEIDLWIAESLIKENKKFSFVRSKVGSDIENNKKSRPKTHNEKKVLDNIRQDCMINLAGFECIDTVYLIDNYETDKFDFSDLSLKLVRDASELQKNVLLFTLHAFSEAIISEKKESLKGRIVAASLLSSIAGAIPIPGLSQTVDVSVLLEEANFYKKQFCLTDKVLEMYGKKLDLHYHTIEFSAEGMAAFVVACLGTKMVTTYATGSLLKYVLPGYGNVMGAIAGYSGCIHVLNALLHFAEEDARKIMKYHLSDE